MTVFNSVLITQNRLLISQIGYFFELHPLIAGPIILGLGIFLLMFWYIYDVELRGYQNEFTHPERALIGGILTVGSFFTATGFIVRGRLIWFYALLMFTIGKSVEGAIFVRYVRKIIGILRRAWKFVTRSSSSGKGKDSALSRFVQRRLRRMGYHMSLTFVAVLTSLGGFAGALLLGFSAFETIMVIWTLFVATSSIGVLLWDLRYTSPDIPILPLLGLLFCIVGAEVYAFGVPPQVRGLLQVYLVYPSLVVSVLRLMDIFVLTLGQVAFLLGILFALLVLRMDDTAIRS